MRRLEAIADEKAGLKRSQVNRCPEDVAAALEAEHDQYVGFALAQVEYHQSRGRQASRKPRRRMPSLRRFSSGAAPFRREPRRRNSSRASNTLQSGRTAKWSSPA